MKLIVLIARLAFVVVGVLAAAAYVVIIRVPFTIALSLKGAA